MSQSLILTILTTAAVLHWFGFGWAALAAVFCVVFTFFEDHFQGEVARKLLKAIVRVEEAIREVQKEQ